MHTSTEGGPYEAESRAARCESCYEQSGVLPPCVKPWLNARLLREEPFPLRAPELTDRRAA